MTIPIDSPIRPNFHSSAPIVIHHGDTRDLLRQMTPESVDLVITSPPYGIGKEYEVKKQLETYLQEQREVVRALHRVLKNTGSICWQVGNYVRKGEVFPLDVFFYTLFADLGFKLRNRIIWHFGHGLHCEKRFSGRYETLLWFTKSDEYKFNLDAVRIPSKYPGKKHYKGKNRGKLSGNPLGKNPSDLWEFVQQEWDNGVWDIPNVKSNHAEKTAHPCQFPVELVERCVLAFTDPGDRVFDPYAGSGSTLIGSLMHNRWVIGSEMMNEYISICNDRIDALRAGRLKVRPIGLPVQQPGQPSKMGIRRLHYWDYGESNMTLVEDE